MSPPAERRRLAAGGRGFFGSAEAVESLPLGPGGEIDCCPRVLPHILDHLDDPSEPLPESRETRDRIAREAERLGLADLAQRAAPACVAEVVGGWRNGLGAATLLPTDEDECAGICLRRRLQPLGDTTLDLWSEWPGRTRPGCFGALLVPGMCWVPRVTHMQPRVLAVNLDRDELLKEAEAAVRRTRAELQWTPAPADENWTMEGRYTQDLEPKSRIWHEDQVFVDVDLPECRACFPAFAWLPVHAVSALGVYNKEGLRARLWHQLRPGSTYALTHVRAHEDRPLPGARLSAASEALVCAAPAELRHIRLRDGRVDVYTEAGVLTMRGEGSGAAQAALLVSGLRETLRVQVQDVS